MEKQRRSRLLNGSKNRSRSNQALLQPASSPENSQNAFVALETEEDDLLHSKKEMSTRELQRPVANSVPNSSKSLSGYRIPAAAANDYE